MSGNDRGQVLHFPRRPAFVREPFAEIERRGAQDIVKGLLPAQGFGFLTGPSQSLKTLLALDWALKIAQGEPVLDRRTTACGVVYIASEAPNGLRKRVEAWRKVHRGADPGIPFEMISQAPDLRDTEQVEAPSAELKLAADEMAERGRRLGLIVIDTLAASMPGSDENSAADMSRVLSNIAWLGREVGAFVLVLSHTGKDETRGLRGWSGQYAGADVVIMLTKEEGEPIRQGRVAKAKDDEEGGRFAIRPERVSLGLDADDDEVWSVVIAYEDAADASLKSAKTRRLTPAETVVLAAIGHVTDHGNPQPAPSNLPGVKVGQKAVMRRDVKARAIEAGFAADDEKPNTTTQRFYRSLQGLVAARKVRVEGEFVWLLHGGAS